MHIHVCGVSGIGVAKSEGEDGRPQFTLVIKGPDGDGLTVGEFSRDQLREFLEGTHRDLMADADKEGPEHGG